MSFSTPSIQQPAIPQPTAQSMQPTAPQGKKPGAKSSQPSFIGEAVSNPSNTGQKTLLGQ